MQEFTPTDTNLTPAEKLAEQVCRVKRRLFEEITKLENSPDPSVKATAKFLKMILEKRADSLATMLKFNSGNLLCPTISRFLEQGDQLEDVIITEERADHSKWVAEQICFPLNIVSEGLFIATVEQVPTHRKGRGAYQIKISFAKN